MKLFLGWYGTHVTTTLWTKWPVFKLSGTSTSTRSAESFLCLGHNFGRDGWEERGHNLLYFKCTIHRVHNSLNINITQTHDCTF